MEKLVDENENLDDQIRDKARMKEGKIITISTSLDQSKESAIQR